ncbi:MAG: tetratricopeptide repeat protein [Deltaproteobacteria bacterium]|nr:MAG: tetratricopeptide repeat protein [Deltaproteobacteria bacterium]
MTFSSSTLRARWVSRTVLSSVFVVLLGCVVVSSAWAVDFAQNYERGKLFVKQKYYGDAVKALEQAVMMTARGKSHFGAHYYLAKALWMMGDVARAKDIIKRAEGIMQRNQRIWAVSKIQRRRRLIRTMRQKINDMFGPLRLIPEVDPESVGRLRVEIAPTESFTSAFKKRVMKYINAQFNKKGVVLTGKAFYLPKGSYQIAVAQPQCLEYALTIGRTVLKEVTISERPTSLAVKKMPSCSCGQGKVLARRGRKKMCVCPNGSVWNPTLNRCVRPKVVDNRPWISKNWPWITALGIGVVAAGVVIPVVLIESQNRDREIVLQGSLFTKP